MRARYILPVLSSLTLFLSPGARAQHAAGLGASGLGAAGLSASGLSAKAEAYNAAGSMRDEITGNEVVAQAIFVKLRKGAVSGTPWGTVSGLASRAGLRVASATARPFGTIAPDKDLASRLQAMPGERRARALAAEEDLSRIVEVHFTDNISPREAARRVSRMPGIEYAEPIPVILPLAPPVTPNDPRVGEQNHLAQIRAFDAWGVWQGDTNMVIGVVDAGIDRFHEDLAPNIKENLGEYGLDKDGKPKESNGKDDDNNGVVDDFRGANLTAGIDSSAPGDTRGINHGTVVSGLAAAAANNGIGVAGTGFKCKFFPVKTANKAGGNLIMAYDGIEYCARRGFKVINCSFGSDATSQALQDFVTDLVAAYDVAIIAGAGNNPAYQAFYPAGYRHVLGVGAIDNNNVFGTTWGEQVGVTAPSNLSTNDGNGYTNAGVYTSFATPVVSGVIALVRSKWPQLTADQAIAHVRLTSDPIDDANGGKEKLIGLGRVNAYRAVATDPMSHPAIEIDSLWLTDADNSPRDNFAVGDQGKLHVRLKNILASASNIKVRVRLYTDDTASYAFGTEEVSLASLAGGATGSPSDGITFRVKAPSSTRVKLRFEITADGSYADYHYDRAVIYRPYVVTQTPMLTFTLTSGGRIGYEDYPDNQIGAGVYYDGGSLLFEGGFLFATDRFHVVSNVRDANPDKQVQDFQTIESPAASNDGTLTLSDGRAPIDRKIGLEMRMRVITMEGLDNAYAIELRTKNVSGAPIDSLHIGMFNDWDMDSTEYGQRITYTAAPGQRVPFYAKIATSADKNLVSGVAAPVANQIFYAIQNDRQPVDIFNGFGVDKKWVTLANGVGSKNAGSLNTRDSLDISLVTGKRVDNLQPGAEDTTTFVVAVAYSMDEAVDAMMELAPNNPTSAVRSEDAPGHVGGLLGAVRPNPAAGRVLLPVRGIDGGALRIFDAFGRQVADLTRLLPAPGVRAEIPFDASFLPSGGYWVRLSSPEGTESRSLLLAR